jgi:rhodanese-related sulfurtransferase
MIEPPLQAETTVTPAELHRRMCNGSACEILDVRTAPEFAAAHVAGARLVPLHSLQPHAYMRNRAESGAPLFVICQSGTRAAKAIEQFKRAGFDRCVLVEGGTQAWIDAGLPVERKATRVWSLMRQVQLVVGLTSAAGAALAIFVDPLFAIVPLVTGFGLFIAGLTGTCGLALVLARMPWNRQSKVDGNSCSC